MADPDGLPIPLPGGPGTHHLIPRPADQLSDEYPDTPRIPPERLPPEQPDPTRLLDRAAPGVDPGSPDGRRIWGRIDAFNHDSIRLPEDDLVRRIERAARLFGPVDARIIGVYAAADLRADRLQGAIQRRLTRTHWSLAIALFFFGLSDLADVAIIGFVIFLGIAAAEIRLGRSRRLELEYLECRALAEGLRVLGFWRRAGLAANVTPSYLTQHLAAVDWIRTAIRQLERLAPPLPADAAAIEDVRTRWIEAQRQYFASRLEPSRRQVRWWSLVPRVALVATIVIAVGYGIAILADRVQGSGPTFQAALAWIGGLAVVAESYGEKRGFEKVLVQYGLAHDLFDRAIRALERGGDPAPIILLLGEEALRENGEWLTYFRGHPLSLRV